MDWDESKHPRDDDGKFTDGSTPAEYKRLEELGIDTKDENSNKKNIKDYLGKINTQIYGKILGKKLLNTDIVFPQSNIIHANNHRGYNIVEKYKKQLPDIINRPDYVFKGNTDNRVLVVKNISKNVELVLELSLENAHYSNKVVSMWELKDNDVKKLQKNKKLLYKRQ